jgi:hypothetical protein
LGCSHGQLPVWWCDCRSSSWNQYADFLEGTFPLSLEDVSFSDCVHMFQHNGTHRSPLFIPYVSLVEQPFSGRMDCPYMSICLSSMFSCLELLHFMLWGCMGVPDRDNLIRSILMPVTDIKDQLGNRFMSGNPFVITVSKYLSWRRYLWGVLMKKYVELCVNPYYIIRH